MKKRDQEDQGEEMKASDVKQVIVFESPPLHPRADPEYLRGIFPNAKKIVGIFQGRGLNRDKPTVAVGYRERQKFFREAYGPGPNDQIVRWGLKVRDALDKMGFHPWLTRRIRLADYEGNIYSETL